MWGACGSAGQSGGAAVAGVWCGAYEVCTRDSLAAPVYGICVGCVVCMCGGAGPSGGTTCAIVWDVVRVARVGVCAGPSSGVAVAEVWEDVC